MSAAISMLTFFGTSYITSPYVDSIKDKMEQTSKGVLILTPLVAAAAPYLNFSNSSDIFALVLNVTTTVGWLFMLWMW